MNASVSSSDRAVLRDLAARYLDACGADVRRERRDLWRRHNSLRRTRPPIYTRAFAFDEMPESRCLCRDPFLREQEYRLRHLLFWNSLDDDSIFEPWLPVRAVHRCSGWGLVTPRKFSGEARGSFKADYPIKRLEDADKLRPPRHELDEEATASRLARLQEAVGDLIPVVADRTPAYWMWGADISTDLGYLRGIEHIMLDMSDNPEWLHRLLAFMRDGILRAQQQAEEAGDLSLDSHQNQAMPYAEELRDPAPGARGVRRRELWGYAAAQEFTAVSPAMHDEFMLQYQLPLIERFGLTAYGCCEDLTCKIDMLRQIPNLRRIAVSPFADVARCAEQIGADYVLSYRTSPTDMVGYGFDPERIRRILKRDLSACRGCTFDITLKDVETVEGDPSRVRRWVQLCREIIAGL